MLEEALFLQLRMSLEVRRGEAEVRKGGGGGSGRAQWRGRLKYEVLGVFSETEQVFQVQL